MTGFTIRVELHEATWDHYAQLARNLASIGVVDEITGSDGVTYKLPPAEYVYSGNTDANSVLDAVKAVAARTGRNYAVFVTEAVRSAWVGMSKAR